MKILKVLARVINISILSIFFILITIYALSPSSTEGMGIIGYFNLTNLLFYLGYIIFGIALLQYIRNKTVDWHNFYLTFVLTVFCWISLLAMIFSPFFGELFSSDGNYQLFYVEVIEFFMTMMDEIESSETIPDHFFDYLFKFIIIYTLAMILAIILGIPLAIYGLRLLIKKYIKTEQRKGWLYVGYSSVLLAALGLAYSIVFGEMTTGILVLLKKRESEAWETSLTFQEKISNIKFGKEEGTEFIRQLYLNPSSIILLLGIILLLVVSITNRKLNTNTSKILLDEHH